VKKGYLAIVLHAHLPYVRHLDREDYLEEKWLHEAITETYIPLIRIMEKLIEDRVDFRLTLSLSPPLMTMLSDDLLQERYLKYLKKALELSEKELERTKKEPCFHSVAQMYYAKLHEDKKLYEKYNGRLVQAFKKFQDLGKVEVIVSAGTHGYFPLLDINPSAIVAQIAHAVNLYAEYFGRAPRGMWLPECGYMPGHDEILKEHGLQYFFLDTHGLLFAEPRPRYGIYAPIRCPSGVAAFGRDIESSKQVWSSTEGYPGDPDYREFYRDIGYDLDFDYIKDYIHPSGLRTDTGFKYYRITGKTDWKEPYRPDWAKEKAAIHAGNFMFNRERQIEYLAGVMDRPPLIVSPYDAELFGHWWFEGPQWLEFLFRKIYFDQRVLETITPTEYLERHPSLQPATPCLSSWGAHGYNDVWLEGSNDWIYRHLHQGARRLEELSRDFAGFSGNKKRALRQAVRELLLAQSSDWAFIMKTGTMVEYAKKRTITHLANLNQIYHSLKNDKLDEKWLEGLEKENNIFPEANYLYYQ
jgi:1,4-alpha-glucan branching enzyme